MMILLGDGNEDVSCRMSEANWQGSSKNDDTLTKQESDNFFDDLRCHFVNYLIMHCLREGVLVLTSWTATQSLNLWIFV